MQVDTCWGIRNVSEKSYWHLVPTRGTNAWMFYNNVMVGKGALLSVSAGIQAEPHLENAHTPYSMSRMQDKKEEVFEAIRKERFPSKPSRLKTIYVFDDYGLVERALNEWFHGDPKVVHECRVMDGSNIHKADTVWLNSNPHEWHERASQYWGGQFSEYPFPETIVDGAIFFPDYQSFPSSASFVNQI